jgi:hypothetical protein
MKANTAANPARVSPARASRMMSSPNVYYGAKDRLDAICPANAGGWQAEDGCGKTSPGAADFAPARFFPPDSFHQSDGSNILM